MGTTKWYCRTNVVAVALGVLCASPVASAQRFNEPDLVRLIPRLASMPLAALRALVADTGLESCSAVVTDERRVAQGQRCTTLTTAQLDDTALRRLVAQWRFGSGDNALQRSSVRCRHTADGARCAANVNGPAGVYWFFRGAGAARRLVRAVSWSLTE